MEPQVRLIHEGERPDSLTMIPGTWAHGWFGTVVKSRILGKKYTPADQGRWFDLDSPFASSIAARDLRCFTLGWTERNSVNDRRTAALVLARHLNDQLNRVPDSRHYVVAHSHGGNIATMAFSQIEEPEKLTRIHFSSMSTPFLWTRLRGTKDLEHSAKVVLWWVSGAVIGMGAFLTLFYLSLIYDDSTWDRPATPLYTNSTFLSWCAFVVSVALILLLINSYFLKKTVGKIIAVSSDTVGKSDKNLVMKSLRSLGSVLIFQPPADRHGLRFCSQLSCYGQIERQDCCSCD
jgi:hypothetical protein